jgi:hypothetical protein
VRTMMNYGMVALLAVGAVGCVRVDADVRGIQQEIAAQSFPGAHENAGIETAMDFSLSVASDNSLVAKVTTAQVQNVRLSPTAGVRRLDFFKGIKLALKADGMPDLVIAEVGEAELEPGADGAIELPVVVDFDPAKYMKDTINFDVTLDVAAPADDWSMGIQFTLNVSGGATFGL